MRLYRGSVGPASQELAKAITKNGAVEAEDPSEVAKDLEAVMFNYLEMDREVTERAKDLAQQRGMPPTELGRLRKLMADQKGIKIGEDMMDFLLDQFIEMLMHSAAVEEVYAEDHDLRRAMRPVMRKHLEVDQAVDAEVRSKIKHVEEGSRTWEVEYKRVMDDIQRRRGLM